MKKLLSILVTATTRDKEKHNPYEAFDSIELIYVDKKTSLKNAINGAKGDYLVILGPKDNLSRDELVDFLKLLEKKSADIICTKTVETLYPEKRLYAIRNSNPGYRFDEAYKLSEIQRFYPGSRGIFIRTELLKAIPGDFMALNHLSWLEFAIKACIDADTVMFTDKRLYMSNIYDLGRIKNRKRLEAHSRVYGKLIQSLLEYRDQYATVPFRRRLVNETMMELIRKYYLTLFYIRPTGSHLKELKAFDGSMKEGRLNDFYRNASFWELNMTRKTKYLAYPVFAAYKLKKDLVRNREERLKL